MVEDLAAKVETYLAGGKHRSLHRLSRDSGVPYITLRRIMQHEVKTVALENAVAVLRVISDSSVVTAYLETWYPESGKIFREFNEKFRSAQLTPTALSDLMHDYKCWLTICLAERDGGVAPASLVRMLGERGAADAVAKLETAEVVEYQDGNLHLRDKSTNTSGNVALNLAEVKHFCDTYDAKKKSEPGHMLASMVNGWNEDGLTLVRETLREAALKIAAAANDPRYTGSETGFWGVIAGTIAE